MKNSKNPTTFYIFAHMVCLFGSIMFFAERGFYALDV